MARRIVPKKVRRTSQDAKVEVLTAAGLWVSFRLLPDYNQQAVRLACAAAGYGETFPFHAFLWDLAESAPTEPDEKPNIWPENREVTNSQQDSQEDSQDSEPQDSQDSDTDNQNPNQNPNQNNDDQEQEMTIEDIVRKIAGEMDETLRADMAIQLVEAMDAKIADFLTKNPPVAPTPTRDVIRQIVITERDTVTKVDGIFHEAFPDLYQSIKDGIHAFLPGEPGTGKSHAAEQIATMLGWLFASISLGPTTPESRLWGGMDAHGKFFEPPFVRLARWAMENPDNGAVFCLDEMDNGHPGILATLNSAMANGWFTAPNGDVVTIGKNFVVIGCANTFGTGPTAEFSGRNKLDAATLDRFDYIPWGTDEGMEAALCANILTDPTVCAAWLDVWRTARQNAKAHGLKVFVTMRGCLRGATKIASGRDFESSLMLTLGNKIPADQWRKINPL